MARMGARGPRRAARLFGRACEQTRTVQQAILRDLVDAHGRTRFGRDHSLSRVRSLEDLRKAVPLCDYSYYQPYMRDVLAGQYDALLPGGDPPLMFSMTSGSTGEPKYIPVTRRFLADVRRGWNVFGIRLLEDHPDAWLRPILQISSPMREQESPTGLACGAISGLLARMQKRIVRRMYVADPLAASLADPRAKYYTLLRTSMEQDVAFITTANPSSTLKLIETGQQHVEGLLRDLREGRCRPPGCEDLTDRLKRRLRPNPALAGKIEGDIQRDGALLPGHFWNLSFLANWTGGTLGLYLPRLRKLFGNVPIRDIGLLASEGRFSIPLSDNTPAGPADITSALLEFIPAEARDQDSPETLWAHELEPGREYFLVFSNWTSLMRYNLDDRIRVVSMDSGCPEIEFLCRGQRTSSITGEKITEKQVVEAMRRAGTDCGFSPERFCLQGCFDRTPYYLLRVEVEEDSLGRKLCEAFDGRLWELNIEYASKRKSGRLGPVRLQNVPAGHFESAEIHNIQQRRGRSEQYKHQYLLTNVLESGQESTG